MGFCCCLFFLLDERDLNVFTKVVKMTERRRDNQGSVSPQAALGKQETGTRAEVRELR